MSWRMVAFTVVLVGGPVMPLLADPPPVTDIADLAAFPAVIAQQFSGVVVPFLALWCGMLVLDKGMSWYQRGVMRRERSEKQFARNQARRQMMMNWERMRDERA